MRGEHHDINKGRLVLAVSLLPAVAKETDEQKRDSVRKMTAQTLDNLYKLQPASRAAIQKSAGYAVFDNMGVHLLLVSTACGSDLAVNSKTKQDTFMKMISGGAGFGVGVKDYRVVSSHASWSAPARRADPIAILRAADATRLPSWCRSGMAGCCSLHLPSTAAPQP